jgi:hypothetical protein
MAVLAFRSEGTGTRSGSAAARAITVAGDDGTQLNVAIFAGYCAYRRHRRCPKTNENFGTFSFQRQLSGKPMLSRISLHVVHGRKAQ